jgi:hypothetical protein
MHSAAASQPSASRNHGRGRGWVRPPRQNARCGLAGRVKLFCPGGAGARRRARLKIVAWRRTALAGRPGCVTASAEGVVWPSDAFQWEGGFCDFVDFPLNVSPSPEIARKLRPFRLTLLTPCGQLRRNCRLCRWPFPDLPSTHSGVSANSALHAARSSLSCCDPAEPYVLGRPCAQ